jgi:hypothetical protein
MYCNQDIFWESFIIQILIKKWLKVMTIQNNNIKPYRNIKDQPNHKFWEKLFFIFNSIN